MSNAKLNEAELDDSRLSKFVQQSESEYVSFRFPTKTGTRWMLENKSLIKGGNVRYLQIKNLGLGVVEIRLRPIGKKGTFVVKEWEKVSP